MIRNRAAMKIGAVCSSETLVSTYKSIYEYVWQFPFWEIYNSEHFFKLRSIIKMCN
jgi:hypothetical protein